MESVVKCVIFSVIMGTSCKVFFETFVPGRQWRHPWMEYAVVFLCAAGFMVIAFTEIPPYILQPVRVIVVIAVSAQLCFQIRIVKNLILSVVFCGVYWIWLMLLLSFVYAAFQPPQSESFSDILEMAAGSLHLCIMLFFHHKFKKRAYQLMDGGKRAGLAIFSIAGLMVLVAVGVMPWDGTNADKYAKLTVIWGFAAISLCAACYIGNLLEKEEEVQKLRLIQVHTQNQMDMYRRMQKNYEQQRRQMHDYKNQLGCIWGMVDHGQTKEALEYISKLTGSLKKSADHVNTNHAVVNVVLNQKYQEAYEKGINIVMAINDLSGLTMSEEEIVILLVNLIDNAIEACEKSEHDKLIQFKMVLEDGQLLLSVRNPVKEPVEIKGKLVSTSKRNAAEHGIGLLNVDFVIGKNNGISVLKCEDGWFSFSAMIPQR